MTARTKKVVINLTALVTAVAGAIAWVAPRGAQIVDERYVHQDVYDINRLRDSLNYRADVQDIRRMLAVIDSMFRSKRLEGR